MTEAAIALPNYYITEQLYAGSKTLVYRAVRAVDQRPVVIKLLRSEYPSFSELVGFRNQYAIAKNLDIPGIVQSYSLEAYRNGYALVMEFGGVSLAEYAKQDRLQLFSIPDFLAIALQLTTILDGLYRQRVIHKDIKPANILINPDTKQVKLIDFSIASLLPKETPEIHNPNVLEGTLAYLSPEQTGRMNRGIDYRSDFYSLGVTFYQLLTGQLPFQSGDPMELVHCHLAKPATPVHEVNPAVPQVLSEIVTKLMAKNAENRYQSALGLKHDLEQCLYQWKETDTIAPFALGQRDIGDRFLIPEKLYGREHEVRTLLEAFERISTGSTEMMLVAGFAGIGKTAVVNEVHKPIVRQRGYFIKGKYDQFGRNIPFSAFVQAFRDLVGQLLGESDAQLEGWKTKILDAVGENGQVLIEVIPELERIVGHVPPVPELSGSAAQNRFNLVFQKFTQVFTRAEHPLVLFLDDLQWADSASLKLLQLLMTDAGHLLLVGAYRDSEVNPAHELMLTVAQIKELGAAVNTIMLAPLQPRELNQLVADTLSCTIELASPLTELVYQKTKGNPFFATQFLKSLYEDGLIIFDLAMRHWQCDLAKVRTLAITDDVVEFMALQLQKLPQNAQLVLKLAACIGNAFDLATLAIVREQPPTETAADLWKALQEGLILPISDIYKFYQAEDAETPQPSQLNPQNCSYRFLHDRVQQAAYFLIPKEQKQATHLRIGQLLLHGTAEVERQEKLFDIVSHLNLGIDLITQLPEREALARLNLAAGQKAKSATAYVAAMEYFQTGIGLLTQDCWQTQYELTLNLSVAATEAADLSGDFERMEHLAESVLQQAHTILDQVRIYEIQITARTVQCQVLEAVEVGRFALQQLEIELPAAPKESDLPQALEEITTGLNGRAVEDLIDLLPMSDRTAQISIRLLAILFAPAFQGSPKLLPLITAQMVRLSLRYGNAPASTVGYATYGMVLCGFLGDVETGYAFGKLALKLLDGLNAKEFQTQVFGLFAGFIQHRKESLRAVLHTNKAAYTSGLETGNFGYAGYGLCNYCEVKFLIGAELGSLSREAETCSEALNQIRQSSARVHVDMIRQTGLNLMQATDDPCRLVGDVYDETAMLLKHQQDRDLTAIATLTLYKLMLAYYFGNYAVAQNMISMSQQHLMAIAGMIFVSIFYLYGSLTQLAVFHTVPEAAQTDILAKVQANQEMLQQWGYHAPMNYLHKWHLVEAERHRIFGNKAEAIEHYDRAITLAKENEYLNEEALANELAAKFYLEWGKERISQEYLINAYYAYSRWGAKAKVDDLEQHYGQLLAPILQRPRSQFNPNETITAVSTLTSAATKASTSSSSSISEALDLASILKASQALSREIQLEKLLARLLQVVLENAGADKCALLLLQGEDLAIAALSQPGQPPTMLQAISLEESQDVPASLIYAVKRTLEPIVIGNAIAHPSLVADPYIHRQQPKSLMCTPILNQGKLLGILYLENNLTIEAFPEDRIELLNLLCSQAAIALENARLYQQAQTHAQQLEQSFTHLQQIQLQLVQSEKMSALGNLVAGVAHEINNPIGFIAGNLAPAVDYVQDLFGLINLYQRQYPDPDPEIAGEIETIDLEYMREDLPKLLDSMKLGVERIRNISIGLRTFSRADKDYKVAFNLHEGIDSTLLILKHRLKANDHRPTIEVVLDYGKLPLVKCFPGQLNQVFMNLLANAIDALEEFNTGRSFADIQTHPNRITIQTALTEDNHVQIQIQDNGIGMSEAVQQRIFDHLFTTKAVGKGTGLGLAITHQIVVEQHGGTMAVNSTPGQGSVFTIQLAIA